MRTASFLLLALGLGAAASCFVGLSVESIPYQDPTPAMLAAQARSIRWWQLGLMAGIAASTLAAIGIWRSPRRHRGG